MFPSLTFTQTLPSILEVPEPLDPSDSFKEEMLIFFYNTLNCVHLEIERFDLTQTCIDNAKAGITMVESINTYDDKEGYFGQQAIRLQERCIRLLHRINLR